MALQPPAPSHPCVTGCLPIADCRYTFTRKGYEGLRKDVEKCLRNAHLLKVGAGVGGARQRLLHAAVRVHTLHGPCPGVAYRCSTPPHLPFSSPCPGPQSMLEKAGVRVMLNELSSTVVFERPREEAFVRKWQVRCAGGGGRSVVCKPLALLPMPRLARCPPCLPAGLLLTPPHPSRPCRSWRARATLRTWWSCPTSPSASWRRLCRSWWSRGERSRTLGSVRAAVLWRLCSCEGGHAHRCSAADCPAAPLMPTSLHGHADPALNCPPPTGLQGARGGVRGAAACRGGSRAPRR